MRLGPVEILLIIGVIMLLFGGTLIPKLFKRGRETVNAIKKEMDTPPVADAKNES